MLYEMELLSLPPAQAALILGGLLGLIFGALAQVSRFCFRRGLVGPASERRPALGLWLVALLVAVLGTQALVFAGVLDVSDHRLAASNVPVLAILLGGALFGAGMVLTRGCVSRLTVLAGTGNLRAWMVLAVFGLVAHAAMKGVFAPLRVAVTSVTVDMGSSVLLGPVGLIAVLVAIAALIWANRPTLKGALLGTAIGVLAPLGWFGMGVALFDEFDPVALQSLSFTLPWAETLFWIVASSAVPAGFGVAFVGGVIAGAFLSAALRGELALHSFETPAQTLRYGSGAVLMGIGGVLAGGCTVGAGLAGVPTLSVAAVLAIGAIAAGAVVTNSVLSARNVSGTAVPA